MAMKCLFFKQKKHGVFGMGNFSGQSQYSIKV